ncbi:MULTISPECIES: sensor histidine kinase [Psychrilyobacter]|uniref:histidine kinase n=1 Tax=Psychrilyobacter piezotolerans TaxID=2293438 RepID=A0ABX9KL07_9FUSO|nr:MULTISPECIES: HAMP domain-containing sensor histidine kinase [Psychrilyobacter]MCS5423056.1 HAMP domain-containing histidine kinase [Psychrilyobacter sp. S5]NDI76444.1 HAMP domain-containing histidine kinase [Psychrilyobacter piezotolerans]RDE66040.1 sensor histidine kinase [Psychrilyobacter sp. S5]REI43218.1 sensor histidine kinase [Psychrilyobacter piezotolerans]
MKLKLTHKVFIFSLALVSLVIIGGIYINNNYLEDFYSNRRIAQIKEVRKLISEEVPTEEELDTYAQKYNITINMMGKINPRRIARYELDENNEGNMVIEHRGMQHLEYYKLLPTGQFITLRISMDSIRSTVGIVNEFYIYEGIAILIGSLFFVYIFSLHITRPIIALNSIIGRMVNMDFSYRANIKSGDELEELGDNINFLSSELEKNIGQLKLSNMKLKDEVEKRRRIDELRKEFIASVTHEIKTPVTVINTHAEMLLYDLIENKEEGKEYLRTIISEGNNISTLLSELIKLIKLEEKIVDIKLEKLDLFDLLREESSKYKIDLADKGVSLILNLEENLMVLGDEFKIRQVVNNLLSNGVSYVENNGELRVNLETEGDEARVEIINTGSSIPEDKLGNIWKAFYRVEKSRNRKYGGTGLGLTIVNGILERHGSKFGVENVSDGVKFWFTLEKVSKEV